MRFVCFLSDGKLHLGVKLPDGVLDLTAGGYPRDLKETIECFDIAKGELLSLIGKPGQLLRNADELDYLPPAPANANVLCVGMNYKLHIEEASKALTPQYPNDPVLFSKLSNSLNGHLGFFRTLPSAKNYDYEAELVIIIGKGGMNIPREKAGEHIFGYTCGNDITAREAQRLTSQWLIGKSLPGSAPIGPWIVTGDELDPSRLAIRCLRGDEIVQSSNTDQMIFDVYDIVSFASRYLKLDVGDVIMTGTPHGVIMGMDPDKQKWLVAGESVTVSIEGIGDLTTRII